MISAFLMLTSKLQNNKLFKIKNENGQHYKKQKMHTYTQKKNAMGKQKDNIKRVH